MTRNSIIAVLFVALVAPAAGCRDRKADLSTVKGAFAAFVSIADRGAYNELYPILVKDVQAKIATTHDNVHKAVALIAQHYPPALRQQALADLGPDEVRNAADPAPLIVQRSIARPALQGGRHLGRGRSGHR